MTQEWICFVCGKPVIPGQRFTFMSKGPIHLECLTRLTEKRDGRDVKNLLEGLSILLDNIVRFRELRNMSDDEETKGLFYDAQKAAELHAAKLTKKIERLLEE